jgi:hypothetical protein
MTLNLNCETVNVGDELLVTAQMRLEVSDPEALASHQLAADLLVALEPARNILERIGVAKGVSLSLQPFQEEDEE